MCKLNHRQFRVAGPYFASLLVWASLWSCFQAIGFALLLTSLAELSCAATAPNALFVSCSRRDRSGTSPQFDCPDDVQDSLSFRRMLRRISSRLQSLRSDPLELGCNSSSHEDDRRRPSGQKRLRSKLRRSERRLRNGDRA